jgi:hypothetical protein
MDEDRRRARRAKVLLIVTYSSIALCVLVAGIVGLVRRSLLAASITLFLLGAAVLLGVTLWTVGVGVIKGRQGAPTTHWPTELNIVCSSGRNPLAALDTPTGTPCARGSPT